MKARHIALVGVGFRLGRVSVDRAAAQLALDRLALDRRLEERMPGWRWRLSARVKRVAAWVDPDGPGWPARAVVLADLFAPAAEYPLCERCGCAHYPHPSCCSVA